MSRYLGSETVRTGRNAEHPSLDESMYVHCWNCGFMCHPQRNAHALDGTRAGDGITATNLTYDTSTVEYDDSTLTYNQSTKLIIDKGCPQCGALNYMKEIPSYG